MDNQTVTPEIKEALYHELVYTVLSAMTDGIILEDEAGQSAEFILSNIESITHKSQLLDFLARLSQKWDIYTSLYQKYKSAQLLEQVHKEIDSLTTQ